MSDHSILNPEVLNDHTDLHPSVVEAEKVTNADNSDVPAGTYYPGTIVPDEATVLRSGQIRQSDFLRELSKRLAADRGPNEQAALFRLLQASVSVIIESDTLDRFLRDRLRLKPDIFLAPQVFYDAILQNIDYNQTKHLFLAIEQRLKGYSEVVKNYMHSGNEDDTEEDNDAASIAAVPIPQNIQTGSAAFAQLRPPGKPIPSNLTYGRMAHLWIQLHYLATHTSDDLVMEYMAFWGLGNFANLGSLSKSNAQAAQTTLARFAEFVRVYTIFLGKKGGLKRPDILNLTSREVYEIKSRGEFVKGVEQIYKKYLYKLNHNLRKDQGRYKAGSFSEWRPSLVYPIAQNIIAVTSTPLEGLIVYDLYEITQGDPGIDIAAVIIMIPLAFSLKVLERIISRLSLPPVPIWLFPHKAPA